MQKLLLNLVGLPLTLLAFHMVFIIPLFHNKPENWHKCPTFSKLVVFALNDPFADLRRESMNLGCIKVERPVIWSDRSIIGFGAQWLTSKGFITQEVVSLKWSNILEPRLILVFPTSKSISVSHQIDFWSIFYMSKGRAGKRMVPSWDSQQRLQTSWLIPINSTGAKNPEMS